MSFWFLVKKLEFRVILTTLYTFVLLYTIAALVTHRNTLILQGKPILNELITTIGLSNFTFILFHWDNSDWSHFWWYKDVVSIRVVGGTKWWYVIDRYEILRVLNFVREQLRYIFTLCITAITFIVALYSLYQLYTLHYYITPRYTFI